MTGDCHAGICGSPGVRFPRATRPALVGELFPAAGASVEIPKRDGSSRVLGVPTVADRIAQVVVRSYLEPSVEPVFTRTPTGIGRGAPRTTRSGSVASGVGATTGESAGMNRHEREDENALHRRASTPIRKYAPE